MRFTVEEPEIQEEDAIRKILLEYLEKGIADYIEARKAIKAVLNNQ